jgi:hypothetical protein
MKISNKAISHHISLLYKKVKFSNAIIYSSHYTNNLTIDTNCSSATCSYHTIVLTPSNYSIELWGSQGGTATYAAAPGNGSYVKGSISVTKETTIYAFIGNIYGFNGGGLGGTGANSGANGGGATDIRLGGTELGNRIMVAAGGGGGGGYSNWGTGGDRMKLSGGVGGNGEQDGGAVHSVYCGSSGQKGTQENGGAGGSYGTLVGTFTHTDGTYYPSAGGGGGGGYFGGGGGGSGSTDGGSYNYVGISGNAGTNGRGGSGADARYSYAISALRSFPSGGGGGGSSFIDSSKVVMHQMLNGGSSFANVVGVTQDGNQRNGAIRIIQIGKDLKVDRCSPILNILFTLHKLFQNSPILILLLK